MNRIAFVATVLAGVWLTSDARAQIVQAVNRAANPGEPEAKATATASTGESASGAMLLGQASAQTDSDGTQIGLQAVDLWITKFVRVYGRLTLPTKQEPATEPNDDAEAEDGEAASEAPQKPSDNIIKQLVDPYGGVLNLSVGYFRRLGVPAKAAGGEPDRLKARIKSFIEAEKRTASTEEVDEKAKQVQSDHGAFVDVRGGFKFIDLPNSTGSAPTVGESQVSVFYTAIAGMKYIHSLYDVEPTNTPSDDNHVAGGLTAGFYAVFNYAADVSQSDIFKSALDRRTVALTGVLGINLPTTAAVTFSFTPWTSDSRLGKTFVFGFDVLRPTKRAPKPGETQETERVRFRGLS